MRVLRKWWIWPIIAVLGVALLFTLLPGPSDSVDVSKELFVDDVRAGHVDEVTVGGRDVEYTLDDEETTFHFALDEGETVDSVLRDGGLNASELPSIRADESSWWVNLPFYAIAFLPPILVVAVLVAALRWVWRKGSAVRADG